MADVIKMDEWLSELEKLTAPTKTCDGFLTVHEMRGGKGWSLDACLAYLRRAKEVGRLEVGRKSIERINEQMHLVPVYRVTKDKKAKQA